MATTTQVRTIIGTTGVSGAAGFTGLVAAHNTAIAAAQTTAAGVTGAVVSTISIANTQYAQDANGGIQYMLTAINYTTQI